MSSASRVAAICGGVGAARMLRGLVRAVEPARITAIANVGDDCDLHGLAISPDLDTITYTVSGSVNPETGWGLVGETWQARAALERFAPVRPDGSEAGSTWFGLGDRDLATHLYRTGRRREGAPLSAVTSEIARAFGLRLHLLPVTDDPLRTFVTVDGERTDFQRWFVGRQHQGVVTDVELVGARAARPAPGVLEAIAEADVVIVCPSNPVVSIGPVLAVPGVREALVAVRERVVAVSPIIAGEAVKGPTTSLLESLGHEATALGVARLYADLCGHYVLDERDAAAAASVLALGMSATVVPTLMVDEAAATALAEASLAAVTGPAR